MTWAFSCRTHSHRPSSSWSALDIDGQLRLRHGLETAWTAGVFSPPRGNVSVAGVSSSCTTRRSDTAGCSCASKHVWRCQKPARPVRTVTEKQPLAASRARLTRRAVVWAADALADDGVATSRSPA